MILFQLQSCFRDSLFYFSSTNSERASWRVPTKNKKSSNKSLNQGYYLHFSSFFEDFTAIYLDFGASHLPKFTFIFTLGFTLFRPKLLISPLRGSLFLFFKNIRFLRNRFQISNFKFHTHYVPTERFCDYYF